MDPERGTALVSTVLVGLLVGAGIGTLGLGGQIVQLRMDNYELRQANEDLGAAGLYEPAASGVQPADLPRTFEEAKADGYVPTYWGRCQPGVGYHYTKPKAGYDGPHLLFGADGTFLGYKFVRPGSRSADMPGPWTWSAGHPGVRTPHWDLFVFVRDPAGACR